jgi:HSP20 family protein
MLLEGGRGNDFRQFSHRQAARPAAPAERNQKSTGRRSGRPICRHQLGFHRGGGSSAAAEQALAEGFPGPIGRRDNMLEEGPMPMLLSDPFDALLQFQRALESFRSSDWLAASPSGGGAYPPFNVFRQGDDVVIITEVPGVSKANLQIQVKGNTIRIAGGKSIDYGDKASLHRRERLAGSFDRAITMPVEIDGERVRAECRDGVLALYLPRAERDKPKSIAIA